MENLTMAQALRHMAERAEKGSDTPWDDLQYKHKSTETWNNVTAACSLHTFSEHFSVRFRPTVKIVNGVECYPHRGELEQNVLYYIPTPTELNGFCRGDNICSYTRFAHARHCVYTTKEGALVEAKAQGWV